MTLKNKKTSVLFVCVHNSARSQMGEAFLKYYGKNKFLVESAGLEPKPVNFIVIKSMKEIGIDISKNKSESVFDFYNAGKTFDYVITVCDELNAKRCPTFPGNSTHLHWTFDDPWNNNESEKEKLELTAKVREEIKNKILEWIAGF